MKLAKLEQSLDWAWKAIGSTFILGLTAIIGSYLLLTGKIDDRYDKIGGKLDHIVDQIGDLRVTITQTETRDDNTQGGAGSGQAGPVHHGAGKRTEHGG